MELDRSNEDSASIKRSKYRGVYKCGKRWKAQLQSQGVQYYLGTFNTEEEAARAYDKKARDEKGYKFQTNFDDMGREIPFSSTPRSDSIEEYQNNSRKDLSFEKNKRYKAAELDVSSFFETDNSGEVRIMWDRLCQISQRLILAKAANDRLSALQNISPDQEKKYLMKSLGDEVVLLSIVKAQLEEGVARAISRGLSTMRSSEFVSSLENPSALSSIGGSSHSPSDSSTVEHRLPNFLSTFGSVDSISNYNDLYHHESSIDREEEEKQPQNDNFSFVKES